MAADASGNSWRYATDAKSDTDEGRRHTGLMLDVCLLSNGRYDVMLTAAGSGYRAVNEMDVTRWREDSTPDCWGQYCYVRATGDDRVWFCRPPAFRPSRPTITRRICLRTGDHPRPQARYGDLLRGCGRARCVASDAPSEVEYETDRARFLGRGGSTRNLAAMDSGVALSGSVGPALDPVLASPADPRRSGIVRSPGIHHCGPRRSSSGSGVGRVFRTLTGVDFVFEERVANEVARPTELGVTLEKPNCSGGWGRQFCL